MVNFIDNFLNSITMYRLVMYGLMVVSVIAVILGFAGILPYSGLSLIFSYSILFTVCYIVNLIFGWIFKAPLNSESYIITANILFFILWPVKSLEDAWVFVLAAVLAIASKFIIAISKRHIFNPAAAAGVFLMLFGYGSVNWWVGNPYLFPAVLIFGLLVVRKIRRFYLFFAFLIAAILTLVLNIFIKGLDFNEVISQTFISGPVIFFGTIMLTEPQTTPPGKKLQMMYGALTGVFFSSQLNLGFISMAPQVSLVLANIYSYLFGSKDKLILTLKQTIKLSPSIYELVFSPDERSSHSDKKLAFAPGQYLEWTIPGGNHMDIRGNRRYFTIASSPSEPDLKIGIKMAQKPSTFKKALVEMKPGEKIVASQLSGDFILPEKGDQKFVLIAGGIGVTPFRSMIKKLIDLNLKKDIVLFYSNVLAEDFVYRDIFTRAQGNGVKTIYILTDPTKAPPNWIGKTGYINAQMIEGEVPDFKTRRYYLSGPVSMVNSYKKLLASLGISPNQIVTDYFPGF